MRSMVYLLVISQVSLMLAEQNSLELVHVFFRHGARTPEKKDQFPTDPYQIDEFLPMGLGQMTTDGKRMSYRLGENLRRRYDSLLGDIYTPEIVEARSTDFDRTKMTMLAVLAGLFPPSKIQLIDESLRWIPIPYQYDKAETDFMLRRPTGYCPTYTEHFKEIIDSPYAQQIIEDHKDIFEYVSEHTGKNITKLGEMFSIYQTLTAESFMNLTLSEWSKSVYPLEIHNIASQMVHLENFDKILKRLNGGRSLSYVIDTMSRHVNGNLLPEGRKIYLYSGHENNVINILAALDMFEPHVPEYNAAVMIELHYLSVEQQYAVRVLYARDSNSEPKLMTVGNCGEFCPFEVFLETTEDVIPINYTTECGSTIYLG